MMESKNGLIPTGRIHVIGMASVRATDEDSHHSLLSLMRTFCPMMQRMGYQILFYGTEGDEIACDEHIACLTQEEHNHFFAVNGKPNHIAEKSPKFKEGQKLFIQRCETALSQRVQPHDVITAACSDYFQSMQTPPDAILVDVHTGHFFTDLKYKVFPTKVWRAFVYGSQIHEKPEQGFVYPYWNDAVIYHYLDLTQFPFSETKDPYAVFLGRMHFDKGVYQAITSCVQLGIRLKIAGVFPSQRSYEAFREFIQDKKEIEYIGRVNAQQRSELLKHAMCLLCPSYYFEPFGLVAIEAMAHGTPVIATDWGGYTETVLDQKTGFHVGMYQDFIQSLKKIELIHPRDCRQWVENNFTTDVVSLYYHQYLQRIHALETATGNVWYTASSHNELPLSQPLVTG